MDEEIAEKDASRCTVIGRFIAADGSPLRGYVSFKASRLLTLDDGLTVVPPTTVTEPLDRTGAFTASLVGTDGGTNPTGFTYAVHIAVRSASGVTVHIPEFDIYAPSGVEVRLAQVTPAAPAAGDPVSTDVQVLIASAVQQHVASPAPHPVYDEIPDLATFYVNRKAVS